MTKLPFEEDTKPEVRIEDWVIYGKSIWGIAYDHPRFDDGTAIRTSTIVDMPRQTKEGDVVETMNTRYTLGSPYKEEIKAS